MKRNSEYIRSANLVFNEGEEVTLPIPTSHVIDMLQLRVLFDWTVAGGTGAGAVVGDAHAQIVRTVTVRGNDRVLQHYRSRTLNLLNRLLMDEQPQQTPPTSVAAAADEDDRESVLIIPIGHMPHALIGGSAFSFPALRSPTLTIEWGEASDLVTAAADGVPAITNAAPRLLQRYRQDPTSPQGGYKPIFVKQKTYDVVADGYIELDLDFLFANRSGGVGHEVRGILIEAEIDGVAGRQFAYSDALIEDVTVHLAGVEIQKEIEFRDQQQINKAAYGLESLETGAILFDAAEDGNVLPGELWPIFGRGENKVRLNVARQGAAQNRVRVTVLYTGGRFGQ